MTVRVDGYFYPMRMTLSYSTQTIFPGSTKLGKARQTLSSSEPFRKGQTYLLSTLTTPWRKPSNLWTSWVYSLRPRVPSWIWSRWIQSASHRNNFTSPPNFGYVDCDAKSHSDIQLLHPWATFSGDIHTSPTNNQDHTFMGDYIILVFNQPTWPLLRLWRPYLTQTFNNALTVTLHIPLKYLAAKIPYQPHNYFLASFLRDLQHKHKPFSTLPFKPIIKTLRYLRLHSYLFTLKFSEETT